MTTGHPLGLLRELGDIRRERPRVAGESEEQYFQSIVAEWSRRHEQGLRHNLLRRVLQRATRR